MHNPNHSTWHQYWHKRNNKLHRFKKDCKKHSTSWSDKSQIHAQGPDFNNGQLLDLSLWTWDVLEPVEVLTKMKLNHQWGVHLTDTRHAFNQCSIWLFLHNKLLGSSPIMCRLRSKHWSSSLVSQLYWFAREYYTSLQFRCSGLLPNRNVCLQC